MTTIIAGTNRAGSNTLKLAEYYKSEMEKLGYESDIFSLADLPAGIVHPLMYKCDYNPNFLPVQKLITASTKFLFIIPEYNGSYPGVLKVLIDCCKFPESFYGKKAALIGVSSGKYGNIRGIDHFTGICHYVNLHVMPFKIHIPHINKEFKENLPDFNADTEKFLHQHIKQFTEF